MTDMAAHARRFDPSTSHQAAEAITPDLRQLQARVADYARRKGPDGFMDAQMSDDLEDSSSTLRTRRSELTARNIVLDSGRRRRWGESPRQRIVWVHRDFVPDAPPIREPVAPASDADRAEGRAMAQELEGSARQMRNEGRTMFADRLVAIAGTLRRLAQ